MLPVIIIGENPQRIQYIGRSIPTAQCVPIRSIQLSQHLDSNQIPALNMPSIALLDIESGSGAEIAGYVQRFKAAYPCSALLVLIGFGDGMAEQAAIDSGADDVLLRPVSVTRLALTLRNLSELVSHRMGGAKAQDFEVISRQKPDQVAIINEVGLLKRLHHIEQEIIQCAVKHCHGHISNTAKGLGIGRSTLYRKLDAIDTRSRFEQRVLNKHDKVIRMDTVM